jgi:carboxypeptidase C (cathepsin A)
MKIRGTVYAAVLVAMAGAAVAVTSPPSSSPSQDQPQVNARSFVTTHTGVFGGASITYTATAADTLLTDAHGAPTAAVFAFTYLRQGVKDTSSRPVLFIFNGGPGSASLWIHMGAVGPRRIAPDDPAHPTTVAPFHILDNPASPLDVADLVFIDPVGTGFSHAVGSGKPDDFYGVDVDAKATADFITRWLTQHHRWMSPKYVLGESYGTTRAAVLATTLQGGPLKGGDLPGVSLNGVMLLGVALGSPGHDAATQLLLPSLAATAWYQNKVDRGGRTFEAFLNEVRQFAATDYGAALFAGSRLPEPQRNAIAARLSSYTGLSADFILKHHLRLDNNQFVAELLHERNLDVGKYDGRYTMPHIAGGADPVADDAAMTQYTPGYVAAFNEYIESELAVTLSDRYEVIAFRAVNAHWNWDGSPSDLRSGELAAAMRRNPSLKLFVGSGYYDLVTPFADAQYTVDHADIPSERITVKNYESGHMVYLGDAPAHAFARDLREFLAR